MSGVLAQPAAAPARRALLIANFHYQKLAPVESAALDGVALEGALKGAGFEVTRLENETLKALTAKIEDGFIAQIRPGDVILVFYSGYAVQNMDNYLLPVDFDPKSALPLPARALSLTRVQQDLDDRKTSLNIILIDAAREEPDLTPIGSAPGLAAPDLSGNSETAVLFSAPLNRTVQNPPPGSPGRFAALFSKAIQQPASSLLQTLSEVQNQLSPFLDGKPYMVPSARIFYFKDPPPPNPTHLPYRNPRDKSEYVWVPGGTFQAGCRENDSECGPDEPRRHQVILPDVGFWIGQTEVAVQAYKLFVEAHKRKMPSPSDDNRHWAFTDHPMIKVSWPEARAYCEWIGGRLPTGDEWERAARGGTDTRYPWGDEIRPNQAKYFKSPTKTGAVTAPVKSYEPNAYGLFDVSGNVWEWTSDLGAKGVHQTRGGSWYSPAKDLHVTSVRTFKSDEGVNEVGFRCLLPQLPKGASEGN